MKRVALLVAILLIFSYLYPASLGVIKAQAPISIYINGETYQFGQEPVIINGFTLVPMRAFFEALGAQVTWESATQRVLGKKGAVEVQLTIGQTLAWKNNQPAILAQPAQLINGTTMVPLRFIGEVLGAVVHWDSQTRTVSVNQQTQSANPQLPQPTPTDTLIHGLHFGDSKSDVLTLLGPPQLIVPSKYGFEWLIYHTNYQHYIQIGIARDKVVSFYTNASQWVAQEDIQIGSSMGSVKEALGSPLSYIRKGNILFNITTSNKSYATYEWQEAYLTLFYDLHKGHTVEAILAIDQTIEQEFRGFYAAGTAQLATAYALQNFELLNAFRVKEGLSPLIWSEQMAATATKHSADMAVHQYFAHINLAGESPFDRMTRDGITYRSAGENIAFGQTDAIFAHSGWLNSSTGHRQNMLGGFTHIGIGVAFAADNVPYYTQKLFTPR
jgi:uncharacterized protein YkwD